jgi:hypothetical protein
MVFFSKEHTYLELDQGYLRLVQVKKDQIIYNNKFNIKEELKKIELPFYLHQLPQEVKGISLLIPPTRLFIRTLQLPTNAQDKLTDIIKLQVLKKFPYDESSLYFTYHSIKSDNRLIVIVFIALKDYIDQLYQLCYQAEIEVKAIIPMTLIFNQLHQKNRTSSKPVLYLDLMEDYQCFAFYNKDDAYIRSSSRVDDLSREVEETINYLEDTYNLDYSPELIVGGKRITEENLEELANQQDIPETAPFWTELAKVEKNLDSQDFLKKISTSKEKKDRSFKIKISAIIILILLINSLSLIMKLKIEDRELAKVEEVINRTLPLVSKVNDLKIEEQEVGIELELLNKVTDRNSAYLPWLMELSRILTGDIGINQVVFKDNRLILLEGNAPSATEVMASLEESQYFINLYFVGNIVSKGDYEEFRIAGDLVDETK